MLEDLAENEKEKYATFWKEFGRVIQGRRRRGPRATASASPKLLRFASTHKDTEEQDVSLADYVARMKHEQDKIYYVTAETFAAAKNSPHLEVFRKKGIEVLLHVRPRRRMGGCAFCTEFEGKKLQSVAKGRLDLGKLADEAEKKEQEKEAGESKDSARAHQESAGRKGEGGARDAAPHRFAGVPGRGRARHGRALERLLKAAGQNVPASKPILEINPHHPLVQRLKDEADEARFTDWARCCSTRRCSPKAGSSRIRPGFVKRLNQLMLALGT